MSDNRSCLNSQSKETVCIDTYRVLDSCRDKDCFENVKVYLTEFGEEIIDRTSTVRAKCAKIISAYIDVNEVPFNRGFYQLNIRIYVKIICEACLSQGNIQEFEGIAVVEKKVILFGSEGNVSVFKSEPGVSGFCPDCKEVKCSSTLPTAVIETVDPIVLSINVVEPRVSPCCCCCCVEDIPEYITNNVNGALRDNDERTLVVSLGLFSVVRIERPAQLLINATEYNIPEKECIAAQEDDPCTLFRAMSFPINEFSPPTLNNFSCGCGSNSKRCDREQQGSQRGGCGCNN